MLQKCMSLVAAASLAALTVGSATAGSSNSGASPRSAGAPNILAPYAQAAAFVGQNGNLIRAKGFRAYAHPSVGVHCFELPPGVSRTTTPLTSIEWNRSLGVALFAQALEIGNTFDCPADPRTLEVRTYKGDAGGVGSALQIPELSDQVAFFVALP
jgi:hypothetical protein